MAETTDERLRRAAKLISVAVVSVVAYRMVQRQIEVSGAGDAAELVNDLYRTARMRELEMEIDGGEYRIPAEPEDD